ncbi:MAG: AmmeMemoRadiSam system protein B [Candidatus Hydrogenedentes bacterium]|nr:AmmeMemoRadiSam system protein B [Candidatus Hydrogenedentota bacterium]
MRQTWQCAAIIAVAGLCLGAGIQVRPPVGPGVWYPADPAQLRAAVEQYIAEADVVPLPGRVVGCIVPHASYPACGAVAAHAFKPLQRGQYDRVIVLAPSLYATFRGCSIASVPYYRTPLGDIPLDADAVRHLSASPLFNIRSLVYGGRAYQNPHVQRVALHEREHSVEVVLPFLQVQLGDFNLVPIVMGELKGYRDDFDERAFEDVVERLRAIIDDRTFVVVTSDFTRYGVAHGFTPYEDHILERIARLDFEAFDLIQNRDVPGFTAYIDKAGNHISGHLPIRCLMEVLPPYAHGVMLRYDTSGRITGDPSKSVSFAAISFFDPTLLPPEPRPAQRDAASVDGSAPGQ